MFKLIISILKIKIVFIYTAIITNIKLKMANTFNVWKLSNLR